MSRHSFDTLLLDMRLSPMACAKSSILPVDSSDSWMMAAIAFSALRRGSRNPGTPCPAAASALRGASTACGRDSHAPGLAAVAALVVADPGHALDGVLRQELPHSLGDGA